jgi:Glycosyl transferases group 1
MPKVCYFNSHLRGPFHGYDLSSLDPAPYFLSSRSVLRRAGRRARLKALLTAAGIDRLYRERDPAYMRYVRDFVDAYRDADLLIMSTYNPIHPEVLQSELAAPTKVLGFIDDPYSTYTRGIPYLWAFDAAFYVSPGYNQNHRFAEALRAWGCDRSYWFPLSTGEQPAVDPTEAFFADRDVDLVYIGAGYAAKIERLAQLKRHFGARFRVHGRWRLRGNIGWARGLLGKPVYPYRVSALSDAQRRGLYLRSRIGLNMHLSDLPSETGNLRMYEVPAHGAMLLCDKAARDAHEVIFKPGVEAVFYENLSEAIALVEYYLAHPVERIAIARAGFERMRRDYNPEANLKGLLDWASGIRARGPRRDSDLTVSGG